jgi:Cu/Ag efflux protein CusF
MYDRRRGELRVVEARFLCTENAMHRIIGLTAAAAMAAMASAAGAAEWTGTIKDIDETAGHIVVTDEAAPDQEEVFAVSNTNTVGATLQDLKEGDKVRIFYSASEKERSDPINAMQIDKVEE